MVTVNPVGLLCLIPLALYFRSMFGVTSRLRSAYPETWDQLGRPGSSKLTPLSVFLLMRYVFLTPGVTGKDQALGQWI